jgi:hypothetical protein
MQISGGTITLVEDSSVVTGDAVDWSQVLPGNYLIVNAIIHEIISVNLVADPPELHLVETWKLPDLVDTPSYVIARDFTKIQSLPLINAGDLEAAALLSRALNKIDTLLGTAGSTTNETLINQTGHGFVVGNALRYDAATPHWKMASSGDPDFATIVGVVSTYVDANYFKIKTEGLISGIYYVTTPLTAGATYYLKDITTPGAVNITKELLTEVGPVTVPLLMAIGPDSGYLLNLATAQSGFFGLDTPGIVPGPPSVDGDTFLRDDGTWVSGTVGDDSLDLSHLAKPDPLVDWPTGVNWDDWLNNVGTLSIWSHMNNLNKRTGDLELSLGTHAYTRLVYTRKNVEFPGDLGEISESIPVNVNSVIVTLIPGYYTFTSGTSYVNSGHGTVQVSTFASSEMVFMRLQLDTTSNKILKFNIGPNTFSVTSPDAYIPGRAYVKYNGDTNPVGLVWATKNPTDATFPIGESISGVQAGITYHLNSTAYDVLHGIYRSVIRPLAITDGSWAHFGYTSAGTPAPAIDKLETSGFPYSADTCHCGAIILEFGSGAVFGSHF